MLFHELHIEIKFLGWTLGAFHTFKMTLKVALKRNLLLLNKRSFSAFANLVAIDFLIGLFRFHQTHNSTWLRGSYLNSKVTCHPSIFFCFLITKWINFIFSASSENWISTTFLLDVGRGSKCRPAHVAFREVVLSSSNSSRFKQLFQDIRDLTTCFCSLHTSCNDWGN